MKAAPRPTTAGMLPSSQSQNPITKFWTMIPLGNCGKFKFVVTTPRRICSPANKYEPVINRRSAGKKRLSKSLKNEVTSHKSHDGSPPLQGFPAKLPAKPPARTLHPHWVKTWRTYVKWLFVKNKNNLEKIQNILKPTEMIWT